MDFYNTYVKLCKELGSSPSQIAVDAGFSKPTVSRWKKGGGCTDINLAILASYFTAKLGRPITVQYLKGDNIQTGDDLAAGVPLAMYDGDQYKDVPEDVKTLAAAVALAKKMQEKSSPAKKADEQTLKVLELMEKIKQNGNFADAMNYLEYLASKS